MIIESRLRPAFRRIYSGGLALTDVQTSFSRSGSYLFVKRAFDIIGSFMMIVFVLSWLTPIVAILIRLDTKGPVFFRQKRIGRHGNMFFCIKFRSMIESPDADKKQASPGDHRITKVGRFLRNTNIDELPQLLNVLVGEMSLVGPRPHMSSDYRRFSNVVPAYPFRSIIRPGITGLAQIKGFHGPSPDDQEIENRFYWDLMYIRDIGMATDFKILFQTLTQRIFPSSRI